MKKNILYDKLHKKLALKYNTTPSYVRCIRNCIIGLGFSREEMITWLNTKYNQSRWNSSVKRTKVGRRTKSKKHYQNILHLVETSSDEQWNDIVQNALPKKS